MPFDSVYANREFPFAALRTGRRPGLRIERSVGQNVDVTASTTHVFDRHAIKPGLEAYSLGRKSLYVLSCPKGFGTSSHRHAIVREVPTSKRLLPVAEHLHPLGEFLIIFLHLFGAFLQFVLVDF